MKNKFNSKIIRGAMRLFSFCFFRIKMWMKHMPMPKRIMRNRVSSFQRVEDRIRRAENLYREWNLPLPSYEEREQKPERAILYICGGGGVYDYCRHQLFLAKKLLNRVDCEVFYPFYPPSTKQPINETYRMIFETYKLMLKKYDHKKTAVLGYPLEQQRQ